MRKVFIALLFLTACTQVDQERLVNETLESMKPCILDLALTQDLQAAETCMAEKVGAVARDEIELALGDYLAKAKPEILELFYAIFGLKSPYSIAHEIVKVALGYYGFQTNPK